MKKPEAAVRELLRLDELAASDSFIHALHPAAKLIVTLIYIVCAVSAKSTDLFLLCVYFVYPALMIPLAEIPLSAVIKRILPALPFVLFAGLSNVLFDRQIIFVIGSLNVSRGAVTCAAIVFKTVLAVSSVIILAATTPSSELFAQLRRFHVPAVLVTVVMLCFRYLGLLAEEAVTMRNAYLMRAHGKKGVDIRDSGRFLGSLLVRCADRAQIIYQAMLLRGYSGNMNMGRRRLRTADVLYSVLLGALMIALRIVL